MPPDTQRRAQLPMWRGYRSGAREPASSGELKVDFHGSRLTKVQAEALASAVKRAAKLKPLIIDAILAAYSTLRVWKRRPKTMTRRALQSHVEPWELLLTKDRFQGEGYVAYLFSCSWDPSGFVVLTHGERVVSVGDFEVLASPHVDPLRGPKKATGPSPAARRLARTRAVARAKKNPHTLRTGADETWVTLPTWAGFSSGGREVSRGQVGVTVGGDTRDDALTREQEATFKRLIKRAAAEQRLVLDAIVEHFPTLTRGAELALPKTVDRAALQDLVELTSVHLHRVHRGGVAWVGYGLACAWDREHGIGVMTHDGRVVEVGGADTAILGWIAERDFKRRRA